MEAAQAGAAAASSPQTSSDRRTTQHEVTEVDRQAVVRVKRRLRRSAFAYVAAIFVYIVVTALADTGTVFSDMPGAVQRERGRVERVEFHPQHAEQRAVAQRRLPARLLLALLEACNPDSQE